MISGHISLARVGAHLELPAFFQETQHFSPCPISEFKGLVTAKGMSFLSNFWNFFSTYITINLLFHFCKSKVITVDYNSVLYMLSSLSFTVPVGSPSCAGSMTTISFNKSGCSPFLLLLWTSIITSKLLFSLTD